MNYNGYGIVDADASTPSDDDVIIRQSTINSMELCAARIGYKDVEGYFDPFSEPLVFGSLVHELIELAIEDGDVSSIIDNADYVLDAVMATKFNIDPNEAQGLVFSMMERGMVTEAQHALKLFWSWWEREQVTTPVSEHQMYAQLGILPDERKVWLFGTPDLYTVEGKKAYDWKTAGRGWSIGKADHMIQASLYSHLIHHETDVLIEDWEFLVLNRRKGEWESHKTTRNTQQIEAAKKIAWMRALMVAHEIYPATPIVTENFKTKRAWYCSPKFCPAWNVCEFKYIADGFDEQRKKEVML